MMCALQMLCVLQGIQSINNITAAPVHAVPSVAKVFLIQAIVMCIFSTLARAFYEKIGKVYENIGEVYDADGVCGRRF